MNNPNLGDRIKITKSDLYKGCIGVVSKVESDGLYFEYDDGYGIRTLWIWFDCEEFEIIE